MGKIVTIKNAAVFKSVVRKPDKQATCKYLSIKIKRHNLPHTIFGIIASRKTGNAVQRNKIKRRIRCILRDLLQEEARQTAGNVRMTGAAQLASVGPESANIRMTAACYAQECASGVESANMQEAADTQITWIACNKSGKAANTEIRTAADTQETTVGEQEAAAQGTAVAQMTAGNEQGAVAVEGAAQVFQTRDLQMPLDSFYIVVIARHEIRKASFSSLHNILSTQVQDLINNVNNCKDSRS